MVFTEKNGGYYILLGWVTHRGGSFSVSLRPPLVEQTHRVSLKRDAQCRPEARVIGRAKPAVMWRRDTLKRQSYVVVTGRDIT
jgi:hypothetical protein